MMNTEFQHFVESQLIEVRNMKMQMIQFVSILNLIQMKVMKVIHILKNMMNRGFQLFEEFQYVMKLKNYESICDVQYQSEIHVRHGKYHFLFQSRLNPISYLQMQTH
jgi:hypothetical protein